MCRVAVEHVPAGSGRARKGFVETVLDTVLFEGRSPSQAGSIGDNSMMKTRKDTPT